MFDVLLLKNKSFVFFSFLVHTSWPTQQEFGSGRAASRKCWKLPHRESAAAGKPGCRAGAWGRGAPPSSLRTLKALLVVDSDRTHGGSLHHSFCLLMV